MKKAWANFHLIWTFLYCSSVNKQESRVTRVCGVNRNLHEIEQPQNRNQLRFPLQP